MIDLCVLLGVGWGNGGGAVWVDLLVQADLRLFHHPLLVVPKVLFGAELSSTHSVHTSPDLVSPPPLPTMSAILSAGGLQAAFSAKSVRKTGLRAPSNGSKVVMSASRPLWLPGSTPPAHLDGSMTGDFGWDPLGLGANPEAMTWFREAELQNGRWAMMGTAGILGQVGYTENRSC